MISIVDVTIQDLFFTAACPCPISPEIWQQWFQRWLEILSPEIPTACIYELTLRLTDDDEIQTLNDRYRRKDSPTDVLAFAALEVDSPPLPPTEPLYLGDIIISVPTASRQAQERGHFLPHELPWLASHGFLHLLGWDHPDEGSLEEMLAQQQVLLNSTRGQGHLETSKP